MQHMNEGKPLYYADYLQLDKILNSQHPVSFTNGNEPAHDEMLFIVIHQAYELWFKQILFELQYVQEVLQRDTIDDNSEALNLCRHRLRRVVKILELLNQQITVLDTMTPLDFLAFRNLLTPASGFQSTQFRMVEAMLGLTMDNRHQKEYYKRTNDGGFTQGDYQRISGTENEATILQLINGWLERMPFFDSTYWNEYQPIAAQKYHAHPFWNDYRHLYAQSLTEREAGKRDDFDAIFLKEAGVESSLSPKALRAALFIHLYRDFPVFQTSYQVLDALVEIDHWLAGWRHKHYVMVRRMIGMRVGTGNTTGAGYLQGAVQDNYVFRDLAALSTFLIQRKNMPVLPEALIRALSFHHK